MVGQTVTALLIDTLVGQITWLHA